MNSDSIRVVDLFTEALQLPAAELRVPLAQLEEAAEFGETPAQGATTMALTLEEAQRKHILDALAETNWIVGGPKGAAMRLGLKRTTLISKMRKMAAIL